MSTDYLRIPLRRRLEMHKEWAVAQCKHTSPPCKRGADPYAYKWGGEPWKIEGRSIYGRFHESPDNVFRFVGYADTIVRIDHTGWFTDSYHSDTTRGVVFRLNHDAGYIYGCTDENNGWGKTDDGPVIFEVKANGSPIIAPTKEDAARWADQFAEHYAESCRDDDAKQMAEQDIEHAKEEIKEARESVLGLTSEMKEMRGIQDKEFICSELWASIARYRRQMHSLHRKIKRLTDDPWSAVER